MAMDRERLENRIISYLKKFGVNTNGAGRDEVNWIRIWAKAISYAVVDEIQQNAETVVEGERIR
jgi:hypothetical protein